MKTVMIHIPYLSLHQTKSHFYKLAHNYFYTVEGFPNEVDFKTENHVVYGVYL